MENQNEKIAVELIREKSSEHGTHYLMLDGSTHYETDSNNELNTRVFKSSDEILKVLKENFETLKKQGFILFSKSNEGTPFIIETFVKPA